MVRLLPLLVLVLIAVLGGPPVVAAPLDLVVDGKPVATIVVEAAPVPAKGKRREPPPGDEMAARTLQEWVRKITGAELPVATAVPNDGPAVFVGPAAVKAGLRLDAIDSPSHEGLRVVCDGRRALAAGQNGTATVKAACRLLEELGCRFFMDSPLGEVYPRTATLRLKELDLREKPGFVYRKIWGSMWSGRSLWKIWNGDGGEEMGMSHAWGGYVPKDLFDSHPEYFALRDGKRKKGDWYCTSNAELRRVFAEGVIKAIESGHKNPSVSPPDGTGYCECEVCRRQDDPRSLEPSSGRVAVSNRYADFINAVARQVARRRPESLLSYYCYADYTQAPSNGRKLEPNVVAWLAPIRYCRYHRIAHPLCPSRMQLDKLVGQWSKSAHRLGYRTYNYNLAECAVPFSLATTWMHDIPYLKRHGCIGINLETLASWQIYGPHIWLSIRLAYDPDADADALMKDYFANFFGPAGGPMHRYWVEVDRAYSMMPSHAGSFYALHRAWTPAVVARCQSLLDEAARAARADPVCSTRVAMNREGFENAVQYLALRDALNRGEVSAAKVAYDRLLARAEAQQKAGYGNHYTPAYIKRFLGGQVEAVAALAPRPNRVAAVLPDRWRTMVDHKDRGLAQGYARPGFDDSAWSEVATYGDTLDGQGLPDHKTILWYRTEFQVPRLSGKPSLAFVEVDGEATVFLDGKEIGTGKKRTTFALDPGPLTEGAHQLTVRLDHSRISELFLGGIVRPVYLLERAGE